MSKSLVSEGYMLLDLDDEGVAHLRMNRPDASNGMNIEFLQELYSAIMTCYSEPGLRVVLLSGEGKNFSAGGDIKTFASKGEQLPDYLRSTTSWLQICMQGLINMPAPVIVAVHGYAAGGGGFGLVCSADIVIAAESAKFLSGATRVGMSPDAGVSVTLPQLVGLRKALEITLTNPTLSAQEALDIGLITRVVPDDSLFDEARALATSLANGAPQALAAAKRLMWGGLGSRVEAQLPEEARSTSFLSGTADSREGLAAVIEKRAPKFTGN